MGKGKQYTSDSLIIRVESEGSCLGSSIMLWLISIMWLISPLLHPNKFYFGRLVRECITNKLFAKLVLLFIIKSYLWSQLSYLRPNVSLVHLQGCIQSEIHHGRIWFVLVGWSDVISAEIYSTLFKLDLGKGLDGLQHQLLIFLSFFCVRRNICTTQ